MLSVEDPKFVYFIKNIVWNKFAKRVGFITLDFKSKFDYALSFAGQDRAIAELLSSKLIENGISVFYDTNEQSEIMAQNVEDYLRPIYKTEARFVVPLLSKHYSSRLWTKFESDQFKERFGDNSVIPIWFSDCPLGMFDASRSYGGYSYDCEKTPDENLDQLAELLIKKMLEIRASEAKLTIDSVYNQQDDPNFTESPSPI